MCVQRRRHFDSEQADALAAQQFAGAAITALLRVDDWDICEQVAETIRDVVAAATGSISEVTVIVHRDSIELFVASTGTYSRREIYADAMFATAVECSLI